MQSVLITGANGFVGHYLINHLLHQGYRVIATAKDGNRHKDESENLIFDHLDFTNGHTVKEVLEKYKPAVIVHAGAISKPDKCEQNKETAYRINVSGTINLLEEASNYKSFFIFISTDFVFDGEKGFYKEDDLRKPVNYYGETKLIAEDAVMKYGFDWAIVRTVLVYGKSFSGRDNLVTNVAKALTENKPLKIFDDQVRTPTYVEDLVNGVCAIIERKARGVYHLSGEDVRTPYEIAIAVAELLHLDKSLITRVTAGTLQQPVKRPLKTGFNISKAKENLGFNPMSFDEGLKKTFSD